MRGKTLPAGWEYAGELFGKGKVYIAGPMTGIPQFNFPAFDAAAWRLRELGFDVISPAEMDDEATRAAAMASPDGRMSEMVKHGSWAEFLARDIILIVDGEVEGIVVLKGWESSSGARLETFVGAAIKGLPVFDVQGRPVRPIELVKAWAGILWQPVLEQLGRGVLAAFQL